MNNNFIENGFNFDVIPSGSIDESLPADSYKTAFDPNTGRAWLVRSPGQIAVSLQYEKIYGEAKDRAEHAVKSWQLRGKHTGVLLSGVWGTGKSITAHLIASKALIDLKVPVIFVAPEHINTSVIDLISGVTCECVVVMDEIDKGGLSYDDRMAVQGKLLELLDGANSNNHLYVLICNDTRGIPFGLLNRPGRLLYHWKHSYLTESEIREVCEDRGIPEDITEALCRLGGTVNVLTYDTISALLYEYTELGIHPATAIKYLNIAGARSGEEESYICVMKYKDIVANKGVMRYDLQNGTAVDIYFDDNISEALGGCWGFSWTAENILKSYKNGKYIHTDQATGVTVELTPVAKFDRLANPYIWG